MRLSLTGFVNRLKDAIANVTLGQGPGTFPGVGFVGAGGTFAQRQNVDAVKVRGIEASAEWTRGPWSVRAGASVTHARIAASGAAAFLDGLRPAQTPNFAATLAGGWEQGGKGAQIVLRRIGRQFDDDLNTDELNAATTVDAFASWPLTDRLQLVARGGEHHQQAGRGGHQRRRIDRTGNSADIVDRRAAALTYLARV